eukprot:2743797-Pyramimonas_sp.AAC.1
MGAFGPSIRNAGRGRPPLCRWRRRLSNRRPRRRRGTPRAAARGEDGGSRSHRAQRANGGPGGQEAPGAPLGPLERQL